MPVPALAVAAAPAVISGLAGLFGASRANRANRAEAERNRQFQERMRNTEWQAAVADMEAAGINPAVAYARGGASSPSGSMAAPAMDAVGAGISSAIQAMQTKKQLELLEAQVERTREETKGARAEARSSGIKADFDTARYMYYFTPEGTAKQPLLDVMKSEVDQTRANSARSLSEAELARFSIPERKALAQLFEQVGGGGKALQLLMPLLLNLSRR